MSENPETSSAEPGFEWGAALADWVHEKCERVIELVRAGDMENAHRVSRAVEFVLPLLREHAGMDPGGRSQPSAALRALRTMQADH